MINEINIYQIEVGDLTDDDLGMMRNSFVTNPAVQYTKLDFNANKEIVSVNFDADSISEQRFTSVSLIADTPIPRIHPITGELFGVVFSKETIKKIVNKFIINGNQNEVSFQHTDKLVDGVYLIEHFTTKNGIVEAPGFEDLPEGSWVTTYYVPDLDQYNALKEDESFKGFSIELNAKLDLMLFGDEKVILSSIESILNSDESDENKELKIKDILNIK